MPELVPPTIEQTLERALEAQRAELGAAHARELASLRATHEAELEEFVRELKPAAEPTTEKEPGSVPEREAAAKALVAELERADTAANTRELEAADRKARRDEQAARRKRLIASVPFMQGR